MAKPPVVDDAQFEHLLKAAVSCSRLPIRDSALLLVLYETALSVTELASITVSDYLDAQGNVRTTSAVRVDVAHNGEERPLYWTSARVVAALDAYLAWRLDHQHGVTSEHVDYRGLDPESSLFLTETGGPYALTKRKLPSGAWSYSCNTLGTCISRLHTYAGIDGGSAQSARRTLAVKLHRQGRDLGQIAALLGHKNVSTTKRLVVQSRNSAADSEG